MLSIKGGKDSDVVRLVESQNKLVLLKKQMRIHVMSWQLSQEKENT